MRTFRSAEEQQEIKEQSMRADESERIHGYGDLKLVNLPKPEASNGKVLVRMTAGAKGCMLFSAVTVLPPEARRQSCPSTGMNTNV